jgi:hypothetical protein
MPRNEAEAGEINAGCMLLAHSPYPNLKLNQKPSV